MTLPVIDQALEIVIRGKRHLATCLDIFDGGYGYYFDALFSEKIQTRFSDGEVCQILGFGPKGEADYASRPDLDERTVRFFIPKWG